MTVTKTKPIRLTLRKQLAKVRQMGFLITSVVIGVIRHPLLSLTWLKMLPQFCRGLAFADQWSKPLETGQTPPSLPTDNPLWNYFIDHHQGPGIWKWTHYFDAYHRHFERFRGQKVNMLEIGIFSGGSLGMWQNYFGDQCQIFGIDIEEACKSYASGRIKVIIGDQESPAFWESFRKDAPEIHILLDDGGHTVEQQTVTLEQMLPHMPNGSVYLCEDITGGSSRFAAFASALVCRLNAWGEGEQFATTGFQHSIHSLHVYPGICVIEKHACPLRHIEALTRGTEWQPFGMR